MNGGGANPLLVGFQDVYGGGSDLSNAGQPSPTVAASGDAPGVGTSPAMFWVGLIGALVVVRLLYHYAKKG